MKLFLVFLLVAVGLFTLYKQLLAQSKKPSGWIGALMMKLWNSVYLPMAKWCLSFLKTEQFQRILDVGVGNGATTKYLRQTFMAETVVGIDRSEKAIQQAKKHASNHPIVFEKADITNTDFPSKYFDLVCAFQTHFHWSDQQRGFLEVKRVLTDDGIFLVGCEYAKLHYFSPELTKREAFEAFLNRLGLRLMQVERRKDWLFYKIQKM